MIDPGYKSTESINNKIERKQKAGQADYDFYALKDHARAAMVLRDLTDVPAAVEALKKHFPGITGEVFLEEPLNKSGYRGIHLTVPLGNGINGEIQLTTKQAWEIKKQTDAIYDRWRNVALDQLSSEQKVKRKNDYAESARLWEAYYSGIAPEVKRMASDSVMGLESQSSLHNDVDLDQTPLLNSNTSKPSTDSANNLTFSYNENLNFIPSTPNQYSDSIIAQEQGKGNENPGESGQTETVERQVRQMLAYAFPQAGQNTADTGDVDRTYSRYYNKKAIKITKQEHARVRAALAEKYARRYSEGRPLPELDYVHLGEQGKLNTAYMYIVRNYDFGSFEVVGKHSSDSKYSENARRDIDEFNNRAGMETDGAKDAGRSDNRDMRSDTEIGREEPEAAGLDRGISESERAGSAVDVAGDIGRTGRRGRGGQRGRDGELRKWQNKTGVITSKYKSYEMYWNEYGGDQYKIKIKRVKEL